MSDRFRRKLITIGDAATLLGVEKHSVHALCTRGRLTRYGSRFRRMVDLDEVKAIYAEWNPEPAGPTCALCTGPGIDGAACAKCGRRPTPWTPCRTCGRTSHGFACGGFDAVDNA